MVQHIVQAQKFDNSRARRELGISFAPIEVALQELIHWYVENGWIDHPEYLRLVSRPAES